MKPEEDALVDAFNESFTAIDLLCEHRMIQSALVLIYSTIDAAAWMSVPKGDVNRGHFVTWVEDYLLPGSPIKCTALELYGARCGVVHSLTAFSRLSHQGKVRAVVYAHGTASIDALTEMTRVLGRGDTVAVHIDDLRAALRAGMQRFLDDAANDEERWTGVVGRAKNLFSDLPRIAF